MSWWPIGRDDWMGDAPADSMGSLLAALADEARPRPTLGRLLAALGAVLDSSARALLADPELWGGGAVVAVLESGEERPASSEDASDLTPKLRHACERVRAAYERDLERRPRLAELLDCVCFVVAANPPEYLDAPTDLGLVSLRVAPMEVAS